MKKILTFVLTAVFIISAMAFVGCAPTEDKKELSQIQTTFVTMAFSSSPEVVTTDTSEQYLERILTATIYPDTAINKEVDWSISWENETAQGNVTEYVNVIPEADGSTTVKVRCYKPFTETILITVTTRENNLQDFCIVTYEGLASELIITGDVEKEADGYYYFGSGLTYTFNIELNNVFGRVFDKFYDDLNYGTDAVGSIVVADWRRNSDNSREWVDGTEETIEIASIKDKYISTNIENGILSITASFGIENYYESIETEDGYKLYTNKFKSFANDDWYFKVIILEPYSGLKQELKIKRSTTAVTNVALNSTTIKF